MKHPNPKCQEAQEEFLKNCPPEKREFHARLFRQGNAAYIYHQQAYNVDDKTLRLYYKEWLEGLPAHIGADMEKKGFEECKNIWSFTRYVNERQDIGLDDWMKEHLSEEDYKYHLEAGKEIEKFK